MAFLRLGRKLPTKSGLHKVLPLGGKDPCRRRRNQLGQGEWRVGVWGEWQGKGHPRKREQNVQGLRWGRKQKVLEEVANLLAKDSWSSKLEKWEGTGAQRFR